MKTFKNVKLWRGCQNEAHETQSSSWCATWRRQHNVQTKKVSYHDEMSVKYRFITSYWNARLHNDKE